MAEEQVGTITHYFPNIGVASAKLTGELKVGDRIHVKGHTSDVSGSIDSLEIEHQHVASGGSGQEVAFKLAEKVRPGDRVYRVS
jgi:putative protease